LAKPPGSVNGQRLTILRPPPESVSESFADAVREGLTHRPKYLKSRYLYDEIGSRLFEQICEQPEYYPTRTEDGILRDYASEMVDGWDDAPAMIELGSGSSTKTRRLIQAAIERYGSLHYIPIEISPTILEESASDLVERFPELVVTGVAADYHQALSEVTRRFPGPKLILFLGSSLGNFESEDAIGLLQELQEAAGPRGRLLLGTDLVKPPDQLEAAYDDANGVTARFNTNILERINRELGADFQTERFAYQARFNPEMARVEMKQVSLADQTVSIPKLDLQVHFDPGETIHVENSHKYNNTILQRIAKRSGFVEESRWEDADGWFRVQRWAPRNGAPA